MSPIHVLGVGLSGVKSLFPEMVALVKSADILVGSQRHLEYFESIEAEKWLLDDFAKVFTRLQQYLGNHPQSSACVLVTGDPLFFGLGRLLLLHFPVDWLTFYPNLSSIQLAFSRIKVPWQDARCVSVHGRSFEELGELLKKGAPKIAVLTDPNHSPGAIACFFESLDMPIHYDFWVCENLGSDNECIRRFDSETVQTQTFASLTVLVLLKQMSEHEVEIKQPVVGIPDHCFQGFEDRPGLMTKREVRLLALGELALLQDGIGWDIGAGTGSVSVEMARLMLKGTVYAVEQSTAGQTLIKNNCQRFGIRNVTVVEGQAPTVLETLPRPDRIFLGGSGQQLSKILDCCDLRLKNDGVIVLAIATLENFQQALSWFQNRPWELSILQVQLSRTSPVARLTRFKPLNPVYLMTAVRSESSSQDRLHPHPRRAG